MSGGGEHLKDEVRRIFRLKTHADPAGISTTNSSSWSRCGPCLKVQAYRNPVQSGQIAEPYRSCTAPLDVLKIRLQLQIHSLPDPLSGRHSARAARYGIGNTFKNIIHDEGITVGPVHGVGSCYRPLNITFE